jgi:acid phosphatase (class A)
MLPVLLFLAGCAGSDGGSRPAAVPELNGHAVGYLASGAAPNSLKLLPPPPAPGSTAFELDRDYSRRSFALRGTAAWDLAVSDANLSFPEAPQAFSCALNAPITEKDTPHLYAILLRVMTDTHNSSKLAKKHYRRARPFLENKETICTPALEAHLAKEGSYPSTHNAIGMVWALILTEVAPERTDVILERGRVFGTSRIVCNVHWHSDTQQGRFVAADVVARLHAEPGFRADLEAARAEVEALRARGLKPARDCAAEAAAIALQRSRLQ